MWYHVGFQCHQLLCPWTKSYGTRVHCIKLSFGCKQRSLWRLSLISQAAVWACLGTCLDQMEDWDYNDSLIMKLTVVVWALALHKNWLQAQCIPLIWRVGEKGACIGSATGICSPDAKEQKCVTIFPKHSEQHCMQVTSFIISDWFNWLEYDIVLNANQYF